MKINIIQMLRFNGYAIRSKGRTPVWAGFLLLVSLWSGGTWARSIPYPLVFIPGLNESAQQWQPVVPVFESLHLKFGGILKAMPDGYIVSHNYQADGDFFLVEFAGSHAGIATQVHELRAMLNKLRHDSGAPRFVLTGFSMGGLTARAYVVEYYRSHRVAKLLTISTPHQGSNWAYVYHVAQGCRSWQGQGFSEVSRIRDWDGHLDSLGKAVGADFETLLSQVFCKLFAKVEAEIGFSFTSDAIRDLLPVDAPGNQRSVLNRLAYARHPADVRYASVVAQTPGLDQPFVLLQKYLLEMNTGAGKRVLNALTAWLVDKGREKFPGLVGILHYAQGEGDGAVSARSQDMSELPWFQQRIRARNQESWGTEFMQEVLDWQSALPLEIYRVRDHHLAARQNHLVLQQIVAGTRAPAMAVWDSGTARLGGKGFVRLQVDDYLLNVTNIQVEVRTAQQWQPVNASARVDDKGVVWNALPLAEEENTFRFSYASPHGSTVQQEVQVKNTGNSGFWGLVIVALVLVIGVGGWLLYEQFGGYEKPPQPEEDDYFA